MKRHELKVWPRFFDAIAQGTKRFEVRRDEPGRRFEIGDVLDLREWNPRSRSYTGRSMHRRICYIAPGELLRTFLGEDIPADLVVLGFRWEPEPLAWQAFGRRKDQKQCPTCGYLAYADEGACRNCGTEPLDDRTWREEGSALAIPPSAVGGLMEGIERTGGGA